jgi:hypothetical protein
LNIIVQRVLIAPSDRLLHGRVRPQAFHRRKAMDREMIFRANIFRRRYHTLVFLGEVSLGIPDDGGDGSTADFAFSYSMPSSRISSAIILKATIIFEKIT